MISTDEKALQQLRHDLPGRVSARGDTRYREATSIWAAQPQCWPQAVVHAVSPSDAQETIKIIRDCQMPLSVLGRGHDWAGRSLCNGVVLDMRAMKNVAVVDEATVRVAGGASAADVLDALDPRGLATATGSSGAVGMAGLTLGGGYGPLIGRFGLALDNLVAAQVVLADGRIVTADAEREAELFWALQGGGGNFGVVTEMTLRAHRLPSVAAGVLVFPFESAKAVFRNCIEIAICAPEALTHQIVLIGGPDGAPVVMVAPTWCGEPGAGQCWLDAFARDAQPLVNTLSTTSYKSSLTAFDPHIVNGNRVILETCWLAMLDSESAAIMIEAMADAESPGCAIVTHEFKGFASRVPVAATAFGLRRDHVLIEVIASFAANADAAEEHRHRSWARQTLRALRQKEIPGGYANLLAKGDEGRVAKSFGENAARLAEAKRRYDPDHLFKSAIPIPALP
jgi:FAD/FMN-containing dehydrogenase